MTINERIRTLRKQKGLTQTELGDKIGLKKSAISKLESDGNSVTDQNIRLISEAFGVNPAWLRTGEGKAQVDEEEAFIQRMIDRYQMEGLDATIIRAYLTLTREQRQNIRSAIQPLIDKCKGQTDGEAARKRAEQQAEEEAVAQFLTEYRARRQENSSTTPATPATAETEKRA